MKNPTKSKTLKMFFLATALLSVVSFPWVQAVQHGPLLGPFRPLALPHLRGPLKAVGTPYTCDSHSSGCSVRPLNEWKPLKNRLECYLKVS